MSMMKTAMISLLENAINQALRYAPATQPKLAALAYKRFYLQIEDPSMHWLLTTDGDEVMLFAQQVEAFDCKVKGKAKDFLAIARAQNKVDALLENNLEIQGDTRLFMQFQQIFVDLDIDWEAALADKVGDTAGHLIAEGLRLFGGLIKDGVQASQRSAQNYLKEEAKLLAHPAEMLELTHQMQALNQDIEQAEARIRRLKARMTP